MAGLGAGLGSLLGGIGGSLVGSPQIGAGLGGLIGGLFEGPENVDVGRLDRMQTLLQNRADQFFDPNSDYYRQATNNQRKMLADMNSAAVNKMRTQLASQGINSNAMMGDMIQGANRAAGDQANSFANGLYQQGAAIGQGLLSRASNIASVITQAEMGNAMENNSFLGQIMGMAGGLLGNTEPGDWGNVGNYISGMFSNNKTQYKPWESQGNWGAE